MKNKISEKVDVSFVTNSSTSSNIGSSIIEAGQSAFEAAKTMGSDAGQFLTNTAELIGDLNGDGKVDIEDAKIALEKAKQVAISVADETAILGKEVMQSELVKDVAPYAAIGAVIAIPIPFVGSAIGAAIGAGLGLYKNATKKN
ncbi:MAG: hypothetical protein V9G21_04375 [Methylotenera sp.]|nr:hypothetical protein [Methylotenera sp.]HPH08253.1 hypothetical protein [Methylotenera sp.]HPM50371.1 hypothetical protein [Methylotenera sp.]